MSSTQRGNSIISHPFKEWYDQQILEGHSLDNIYTNQQEVVPAELIVSKKTISEYRKNVVQPNKAVIREYREQMDIEADQEAHKEIAETPAFKEVVAKKAGMMIDYDKTFLSLHDLLMNRLEKLDNLRTDNPNQGINQGIAIGELVDKVRLLTMDYLKARGKLQDGPQTQINIINIEQKNAEMDALKNAVIDTLNELDPSQVPTFLQKLQTKMNPVLQTFETKQRISGTVDPMSEQEAVSVLKTYEVQAERLKKETDSE